MGRHKLQATLTEEWIKSNASWLGPDHQPLVGQLRMLATSMDAEMAERHRIAPSASAAYQKAYDKLLALRDRAGGRPTGPTGVQSTGQADDDPDQLMAPAPAYVQ